MNLHLFSLPGAHPLQHIVTASKPYLVAKSQPVIAYLPAAGATLNWEYVALTESAFKNLAEVDVLDLSKPTPWEDLKTALERASVLYIPGGNTYRLLSRLYQSGAFSLIRERVIAGLPLVGFSAGMVICGPNILTSNDDNDCGVTDFTGLSFTSYNYVAHYPIGVGKERDQKDKRIREYQRSHGNPVLALADDGYLKIDDEDTRVVQGHCWLFEAGKERRLLEQGCLNQPPNPSCS